MKKLRKNPSCTMYVVQSFESFVSQHLFISAVVVFSLFFIRYWIFFLVLFFYRCDSKHEQYHCLQPQYHLVFRVRSWYTPFAFTSQSHEWMLKSLFDVETIKYKQIYLTKSLCAIETEKKMDPIDTVLTNFHENILRSSVFWDFKFVAYYWSNMRI